MVHMLSEVFPLLGGIFVALVCMTIHSSRHRWFAWAALSVAFGALATVVSGEYRVSFGFLLFDVPFVAGVAVSVMACQRVAARIWSV
jgi:hypothetical protein